VDRHCFDTSPNTDPDLDRHQTGNLDPDPGRQQNMDDPQPVLRIRDLGSGAFLIPGSGICFFRIPSPYIREHSENFWGKNLKNSLKIGPNFFLQHFKNKIILIFVKFVTKKCDKNFFSPLSFVAVFGSGIRDG
jgi:hypothetical protein